MKTILYQLPPWLRDDLTAYPLVWIGIVVLLIVMCTFIYCAMVLSSRYSREEEAHEAEVKHSIWLKEKYPETMTAEEVAYWNSLPDWDRGHR